MKLFAKLKFHKKHIIKYLNSVISTDKYIVEYEIVNNQYIFINNIENCILEKLKVFVIENKFQKEIFFVKPKKTSVRNFYVLLNCIYNFFAVKYLELNNYCFVNRVLCTENTLFIVLTTKNKLIDYKSYTNIIICHYYEILEYYEELKLVIRKYNKLFIFTCFQEIYRCKIYKKLDIKIESFFYQIKNLFIDFSFCLLEKYLIKTRLSDIIITKKHNIDIKGSSDVLDIKKYINNLISRAYNQEIDKKVLKDCLLEIENEQCETFKETILETRILNFLKSYNYQFLENCYIKNLIFICNLKNIDDSVFSLMKRCFSLSSKLLKNYEKNSIDICEKNKITIDKNDRLKMLSLNREQKLHFIITLLDIYKFKDFNYETLKIIENNILSAIQEIIYL